MDLTCTHCRATLPREDATATHCRFCRAELPHGKAAAEHQARMRAFMANPQGAGPGIGAAPPAFGAPAAYGPMPPAPTGPIAFAIPNYANVGASIGKTVERSMKMGMWITIASIVGTFLIVALVMLVSFLR